MVSSLLAQLPSRNYVKIFEKTWKFRLTEVPICAFEIVFVLIIILNMLSNCFKSRISEFIVTWSCPCSSLEDDSLEEFLHRHHQVALTINIEYWIIFNLLSHRDRIEITMLEILFYNWSCYFLFFSCQLIVMPYQFFVPNEYRICVFVTYITLWLFPSMTLKNFKMPQISLKHQVIILRERLLFNLTFHLFL